MTQDQGLQQGQGTIQPRGITTWMYGSHVLRDISGKITFALQSEEVKLDEYVGYFVTVMGAPVPGYPLDGGPVLLDVGDIVDTHIHPTDASQPVCAKVGDQFSIILPGHATSGYMWKVSQNDNPQVTAFEKQDYKAQPGIDTVGEALFMFRALQSGQTHVSFEEARSWEHEPPAATVTFAVIVTTTG